MEDFSKNFYLLFFHVIVQLTQKYVFYKKKIISRFIKNFKNPCLIPTAITYVIYSDTSMNITTTYYNTWTRGQFTSNRVYYGNNWRW